MTENGKKKRKIGKRAISLLMACFLLLGTAAAAGCGEQEQAAADRDSRETGMGENGKGGEENPQAGETAQAGEKVMGRYVESVNESLEGMTEACTRMMQTEDGRLVIWSRHSGKWVSEDQGNTWKQETADWLTEMTENGIYIGDLALSKDGYVGVIAYSEEKTEREAEPAEESGEGGNGEEGQPKDGNKEPADGTAENGGGEETLHYSYLVVSPENEVTEFQVPQGEEGKVRKLAFSDDGRLFASSMGGKVYEIDWEQGTDRIVADLDEWAYYMQIWKDKMVCVTWNGVYLYDLSAGESVTDKALEEFVTAQAGDKLKYADGYYQPLLVLPSGEDILYLICEKGIFRHVWGGNLVEQLADGSLNSLSDPSCAIGDGLLLENGVFLLVTSGGRLASYTYDPDMPATPDVRIKAYSLTESARLKKAIAEYQAEHPEVYVRYEIGMGGDISATREDALKKLNTEIAAGTGPDLLILDDMPIDSYIEKGILADLTPYLEKELGEGYFSNMTKAFAKDGKICAVPAEFKLPLLGGDGQTVGQMGNLAAIADAAEQYRKEKPEGSLFGAAQEKTLVKRFMLVCAPAWRTEDGKVDEEKLEEFFIQVKRIWDTEKDAVTEKERKAEEDYYIRMKAEGNHTEEEADELIINNIINAGTKYMLGEQEFFTGTVDGSFDFDVLNSYFHVKEREDGEFAPYCGQLPNVFVPVNMVGISQMSPYRQEAGELMRALMETDWSALVLDEERTKEYLRANANEDGSSYGSMGGTREDGTVSRLDIYPATEEDISHLVQIARQAGVPYIKNRVLESAVSEVGEKVLKGEMTAEEGVQEVVRRVSLYMAE